MKLFKPFLPALLAAFCVAFSGGAMFAQDADTAPKAEESTGAVTNDVPKTDTASVTNTDAETNSAATNEPEQGSDEPWLQGRVGDPIVQLGQNAELKADKTAEAVVVIGGNARVDGKVREAVVAVMGNVELNGEVGEAVVAVLGNIKLGPGAKVHGDVVSVGGRIDAAPDAVILGHTQSVPFNIAGLPHMDWLKDYFFQGVAKLRPLPPRLGWVWAIVGVSIFFYFLVAAIFPRPVHACVEELSRRPATTFLMGLLTKMVVPVVIILLAVTGIGLIVVPFIVAVLLLAGIIGKAALLEWIGLRIGSNFGEGFRKPLVAFFIGAIVLVILYMIPVLGLLTLLVTSIWALGCAITATFGGIRKEGPQPVPPLAAAPVAAPAMMMMPVSVPYAAPPHTSIGPNPGPIGPVGSAATTSSGLGASAAAFHAVEPGPVAAGATLESPTAAPINPPVLPEALSYPRAGFWERMGAGFLDIVLVSIVSSFVGGMPFGLLVALAYFAGMWAWKGTTIGAIVLGLKVVRADGQPVSFAVALVRGLAAAFSIVVLFLGILWIAWDPEKQGWHDRIAGTVVIRLPKGTPLLAL